METPPIRVHSVLVGRRAPFGRPGIVSAIAKQRREGPIALGRLGLAGDEHGETVNHGGPEKALLHYALDHNQDWRAEHPRFATLLAQPGAFGENVASIGMTEADVCVGDTYRVGSALVQVSQIRRPCWRLNVRFDYEHMAREVQRTGRCGWYYRVLETGRLQAGDPIVLRERPNPDWTLLRLHRSLEVRGADLGELSAIAALPYLAESLKAAVRALLERAVS